MAETSDVSSLPCSVCGTAFPYHMHGCTRPFPAIPTFTGTMTGRTGWLCPRCGRGNSPMMQSCPCLPWSVTC